ncbi:MAG: HD domain-containing protein [Pseudomonadota bacterium]|nr:HD domain-containing protein [Pseudomonadota bacterium]
MSPQPLPLVSTAISGRIPSDGQCRAWWDDYRMLENIKRHSELVAHVATALAEMAAGRNAGNPQRLPPEDFVQSVRASALLHDLGKTCAIRMGGDHSQLGAAWVMQLTGNPHIAQGVMHHVYWPGELDPERHFLPLAVIYADKRVRHDDLVSLEERFDDLMDRYGKNERSRDWIGRSRQQNRDIENLLSAFLGEDIHAYPFDRRRLVR